jgi:ABC-type uncharacterized transport system permease subunit
MHYIILISIIAAAVVGYIFWRKTESINDVVLAVITSFILFFVYFIITVLLSKGIDHFDNKLKDNNVYETPKPDDNLTSKI